MYYQYIVGKVKLNVFFSQKIVGIKNEKSWKMNVLNNGVEIK